MEQDIRFCTAPDGTRIAYAVHGNGPPLVRAGHWMTHLEFDWDSPLWKHWLTDLGRDFTVIRYDERGCGLSDRDVTDFSLQAWVSDLETVVDSAGLDRFTLLGVSGGGPVAITYAIRHTERVERMILYGTYTRGRRARDDPSSDALEDTLSSLIEVGWGGKNPAFRRVFTTLFVPDATPEQMEWFDDIQQRSTDAGNAAAIRLARSTIDVTEDAKKLSAPTLILHADEDAVAPFDEGRYLAASIDGARFVPLSGRNHILLQDEPAWKAFVEEVRRFVPASPPGTPADRRIELLSKREHDVLALVAQGKSNEEIAAALFLSERTIERHMSNAYAKLGLSGRTARAAAAAIFSAGGVAPREGR
jgi:pimeloyl-ACP methyl ester carboxylesterase/DNA-binding CsgD family transcriptional regulator